MSTDRRDRLGAAFTLEGWIWLFICLAILASPVFLSGCGHVKAVEAGVKVNADNCKEASAPPPTVKPDTALLECISGGEVTVRIELPKKAWQKLKDEKDPSPFGPSPGK